MSEAKNYESFLFHFFKPFSWPLNLKGAIREGKLQIAKVNSKPRTTYETSFAITKRQCLKTDEVRESMFVCLCLFVFENEWFLCVCLPQEEREIVRVRERERE